MCTIASLLSITSVHSYTGLTVQTDNSTVERGVRKQKKNTSIATKCPVKCVLCNLLCAVSSFFLISVSNAKAFIVIAVLSVDFRAKHLVHNVSSAANNKHSNVALHLMRSSNRKRKLKLGNSLSFSAKINSGAYKKGDINK